MTHHTNEERERLADDVTYICTVLERGVACGDWSKSTRDVFALTLRNAVAALRSEDASHHGGAIVGPFFCPHGCGAVIGQTYTYRDGGHYCGSKRGMQATRDGEVQS